MSALLWFPRARHLLVRLRVDAEGRDAGGVVALVAFGDSVALVDIDNTGLVDWVPAAKDIVAFQQHAAPRHQPAVDVPGAARRPEGAQPVPLQRKSGAVGRAGVVRAHAHVRVGALGGRVGVDREFRDGQVRLAGGHLDLDPDVVHEGLALVVDDIPDALIGACRRWCFQVDFDVHLLAGCHRLGQVLAAGPEHLVAIGEHQLVVGVPGAGADVLQPPGFGEALTRVEDRIIRHGLADEVGAVAGVGRVGGRPGQGVGGRRRQRILQRLGARLALRGSGDRLRHSRLHFFFFGQVVAQRKPAGQDQQHRQA